MHADLQASTIGIISLGGRMPQIVMNLRNGHSGQLSAITCGMNTAGCFARMFTTLVLTQVGALPCMPRSAYELLRWRLTACDAYGLSKVGAVLQAGR